MEHKQGLEELVERRSLCKLVLDFFQIECFPRFSKGDWGEIIFGRGMLIETFKFRR